MLKWSATSTFSPSPYGIFFFTTIRVNNLILLILDFSIYLAIIKCKPFVCLVYPFTGKNTRMKKSKLTLYVLFDVSFFF